MAEENSFKDNLNWKKLSIDAINTIIATAIGIVIGLLVDKAKENSDKAENYQKIIVATINNLENYQSQIESLQEFTQYGLDLLDEVSESEQLPEDIADNFFNVYYEESFKSQDRWIEENFIANGNFIEDTDLRLKIGNVYSTIELARNVLNELRTAAVPELDKYTNRYIDNEKTCINKTIEDKSFTNYIEKLSSANYKVKTYIAIIKDLNADILKISKADENELNKMRESSKKINDLINKKEEATAAE